MTPTPSKSSTPGGSHASASPMRPIRDNWVPCLMVLILFTMAGGLMIWTAKAAHLRIGRPSSAMAFEPIKDLPDFSFIDRDGRTLTRDDLLGRIWIADFIFTRCAGTCPVMSQNMKAVQRSVSKITQVWPPIELVSFTVDPQWDTTEVLEKYAKSYGADDRRWHFLTGSADQIQRLAAKGFMVGLQDGADSVEEPIIHSQSFVLIDKKCRIRGYYDGTDSEGVHRLLADVNRLIREDEDR